MDLSEERVRNLRRALEVADQQQATGISITREEARAWLHEVETLREEVDRLRRGGCYPMPSMGSFSQSAPGEHP